MGFSVCQILRAHALRKDLPRSGLWPLAFPEEQERQTDQRSWPSALLAAQRPQMDRLADFHLRRRMDQPSRLSALFEGRTRTRSDDGAFHAPYVLYRWRARAAVRVSSDTRAAPTSPRRSARDRIRVRHSSCLPKTYPGASRAPTLPSRSRHARGRIRGCRRKTSCCACRLYVPARHSRQAGDSKRLSAGMCRVRTAYAANSWRFIFAACEFR